MQGISWLAKDMFASQEELCSIGVNYRWSPESSTFFSCIVSQVTNHFSRMCRLLLGAGPVESHFCLLDMSLITHSNILHVHPAKCSWSLTKTAHHRATLTHNKTQWESQSSSLETENIQFCNEWFIIDFKVIFGRQFYSHNIGAAQLTVSYKAKYGRQILLTCNIPSHSYWTVNKMRLVLWCY